MEAAMGTRIYVGNLPFSATEDQIRQLFGANGRQVTVVHFVMDRDTGRPRGFAFVEMATDQDAQAAIDALNGSSVGGRQLTVNEARERTGGGGHGGHSGYSGHDRQGGYSGRGGR
jgi:RNA recognition motif-containing protein